MRTLVLILFTVLLGSTVRAQNTDLPSPTANLQTLPSGSYVIAMDNTNQLNNSSVFNYKTYGLIVTLLNSGKAVKWVITAGKAKDAVDFTVNATKIKPTSSSAASYSFKAGPFVIFAADTTGFSSIVDTYNSAINNANDKIKVYKTNAAVTVDIRYDLTGFIPKAALLNDGGNVGIHTSYMTDCNIPSGNYHTAVASDLLTKCYTFASEPHNTNSGQTMTDAVSAVKRFVEYGGNFLAQCEAVNSYENNSIGHFQTTTGITDANSNAATAISYPNPDLSYNQFEGSFDISKGGSLQNWRINAAFQNNGYKGSKANTDTTIIGYSVSKLASGHGGLVFYLGNHTFDDKLNQQTCVNGMRMYMNAFLTPVSIAQNCSISASYMYPLSVRVLSFFGNEDNGNATLRWDISENESMQNFVVERSVDGIKFTSASQIPATDRSGTQSYSYSEHMPSDAVYYRIKLTDKSNVVKYTTVLLLHHADAVSDLHVINNPVIDNRLSLEFNSPSVSNGIIKVMDMLGRVQFTSSVNVMGGSNSTTLLLPAALQNAVYIVELNTGTVRMSAKFIKQ